MLNGESRNSLCHWGVHSPRERPVTKQFNRGWQTLRHRGPDAATQGPWCTLRWEPGQVSRMRRFYPDFLRCGYGEEDDLKPRLLFSFKSQSNSSKWVLAWGCKYSHYFYIYFFKIPISPWGLTMPGTVLHSLSPASHSSQTTLGESSHGVPSWAVSL